MGGVFKQQVYSQPLKLMCRKKGKKKIWATLTKAELWWIDAL